jgi:hypothetical protein
VPDRESAPERSSEILILRERRKIADGEAWDKFRVSLSRDDSLELGVRENAIKNAIKSNT